MNFDSLVSVWMWLLVNPIFLATAVFVIHMVVGICAYKFLDYFYGYAPAGNFVWVWFFFHGALVQVVVAIVNVLKSPWRSRNNRLFRETFRIEAPANFSQRNATQETVDQELGYLARTYHWACQDETGVYCNQSDDAQALEDARRRVKIAKDAFWSAHGLAKKFGYSVRTTHGEYIQ